MIVNIMWLEHKGNQAALECRSSFIAKRLLQPLAWASQRHCELVLWSSSLAPYGNEG